MGEKATQHFFEGSQDKKNHRHTKSMHSSKSTDTMCRRFTRTDSQISHFLFIPPAWNTIQEEHNCLLVFICLSQKISIQCIL